MNERMPNLFARHEEYAALRQYVRLAESEGCSAADSVRIALNTQLTRRQKQLIQMYYIEQMRMQDIADELGLNISTVSRTIKRGRERLKSCLKYGGRALMQSLDE